MTTSNETSREILASKIDALYNSNILAENRIARDMFYGYILDYLRKTTDSYQRQVEAVWNGMGKKAKEFPMRHSDGKILDDYNEGYDRALSDALEKIKNLKP